MTIQITKIYESSTTGFLRPRHPWYVVLKPPFLRLFYGLILYVHAAPEPFPCRFSKGGNLLDKACVGFDLSHAASLTYI